MTPPRIGLLFFATLALFLTGCSSGPNLNGAMSVSFVDFKPTESSQLESRGTLTLRFTNESVSPLGYSGSSHKLYLNGKYVGQAVSNQPFGLPPLSSTTQEVILNVENRPLARQIVLDQNANTASYRVESTFFQTVFEDNIKIRVVSEGTLDLLRLREFKPQESSAVRVQE